MMFNSNGIKKICRYGENCRFGVNCKYDHPERYQQISPNNQESYEMQYMQQQFYLMNLAQDNNYPAHNQQGQQILDDAYYQQQIYQNQQNYNVYEQNQNANIQNFNFVAQQIQNTSIQQKQYYNQQKPQFKGHYRGKNKNFQENTFKTQKNQKNVKKLFVKNQKKKKNQKSDSDTTSDQENQYGQDSSDDQTQIQHKKVQKKSKNDQTRQQLLPIMAEDKIKNDKKKRFRIGFFKKSFDQKSYNQYEKSLTYFFDKRHIKPHKRESILDFLSKVHPEETSIVQIILPIVQELQRENFVQHFCYKKLFKTICKQNFDIQAIKAKLMKKINIDFKRKNKDEQFLKRFPQPVDVQFLESKQLLFNELGNKNTIYLIDGNNCLVTQKHLRFYFQKPEQKSKAQAQVRFRWLIRCVIPDPKRCFIFFDDQFPEQTYSKAARQIMEDFQYGQILKLTSVIYPETGHQADQVIRNKLTQITQNLNEKHLSNILLISADRILVQECYAIHFLRKSSGMYFIKFSKKYIKQAFSKYSSQKKIAKRILTYD